MWRAFCSWVKRKYGTSWPAAQSTRSSKLETMKYSRGGQRQDKLAFVHWTAVGKCGGKREAARRSRMDRHDLVEAPFTPCHDGVNHRREGQLDIIYYTSIIIGHTEQHGRKERRLQKELVPFLSEQKSRAGLLWLCGNLPWTSARSKTGPVPFADVFPFFHLRCLLIQSFAYETANSFWRRRSK